MDTIVHGEGEETIVELAEHYYNKKPIQKIEGIIYLDKDKKIIKNRVRNSFDQSKLLIPDRENLSLKEYFAIGFGTKPIKDQILASVCTSRGCPHNCSFCVTPRMYPRYSTQTIENVIKELKFLVNEKRVNLIFFRDENFTMNQKRTIKLCKEIIKNKIKFEWYSFARIDEVNKKTLKIMRKAGCTDLLIGFESGDSSILSDMNKGFYDIKKVIKTAKIIDNQGIRICAMIMIGMPNETKESFNRSIKFLKEIPYHRIRLAYTVPFPGCPLYDENKNNVYTKNFRKYDCEHVILKCKIGKEKLIKLRQKALHYLFSYENYISKCKKYLKKYPKAKESYKELFELHHKLYNVPAPRI